MKAHRTGDCANTTIVFLHGLGASSWMWQDQVEALSSNYQCIAVDLPGNGESHLVAWHSLDETASQVAEIVAAHSREGSAHVVGLSLGGYVALRLLTQFPDRLDSVIVSGVSTRPFPAIYRPLISMMCHTAHWDWVINQSIKAMKLPEASAPLFRQDVKRLSVRTMKQVYREVLDFGLPPGLEHNSCPLLAVAGEKEAGKVIAGLRDFIGIPNATAAIAPGGHHGWNAEAPQMFNEMIGAWVAGARLADGLVARHA